MSAIFSLVFVFFVAMSAVTTSQGSVGVCNGRFGNNLPSEQETVDLYKANGIKRMRLYAPSQTTLEALKGSDIELILDVPNGDLESLQSDATSWVQTNVQPYFPATRIRYIAVGNEVDPDKETSSHYVKLVHPAMESIYRALTVFNLQDQIKVSTATYSALLTADSFPPSMSAFKDTSFMGPIIGFLARTRAPLLVNIYPYFAYKGDTTNIPLSYALFTASEIVVQDDPYGYQNLFTAMVDGMYYAVEKAGGADVEIVVSESGWPSAGGVAATEENGNTYYTNLISEVKKGTPKKPGKEVETYLFAMFDENTKEGDASEQHFGVFFPDKRKKYQLIF
ncbi:hypothetical protein ACS0TY_026595 [Phlomoides rotata]